MKAVRNTIGGLGNLMFKQAYIYSQMRKGLIPDIYVQSDDYFSGFENEIKNMFGDGIKHIDRVSIHIRRGDYMNSNFYVNLAETDYYQKAIAHFSNSNFLVFCHDRQNTQVDKNDRQWAREFLDKLIPNRYIFWSPQSETDDLNAMASCKSNIMANSSFSWWAAYLNPHPDKTVITPNKWFMDGIQRTKLLNGWIQI